MQATGTKTKQRDFEDEMKANAAAAPQELADNKGALMSLTKKHL